MSLFWTLVKNDLKFRQRRHSKAIWTNLYIGALVLLGFSLLIFQVIKGHTWPSMLLGGIPFLVFIAFSTAISTIKYEWRGDTVGWWLSLPYPRWYLLGAKLMATFIRYLKALGYAVGVSIIICLLGMILHPITWNEQTLLIVLTKGIQLYLLIILISPAVMMLGIIFSLLQKSRWRPLSPLFILLFSFVFSGILSTINPSVKSLILIDKVVGTGVGQLFLQAGGVILADVAAVLMFAFATYLLEQQIEA